MMVSRRNLGHLIASQATALEREEVAVLRSLADRVDLVWSSPDGIRLGVAAVERATTLERAAGELHGFGRRIEAEAAAAEAAAAERAAAEAEAAVSARSGAAAGTGTGGVAP